MPTSVRLRGRGGGVPIPPSFTSPATFVALAENNIDFTVTTVETCTFAITGGADQAQFELNGAVLTLVAQAYVAAGNNDRIVLVTATSATTGLTTTQTITAVVTDIATVKLVPTSQWTGAAGTGYDGANPPPPEDPTRTGPKMACRLLRPPEVAFSDDYIMVVSAASYDGVEKVTFYCEGQEVEVLAPKWWPITKPDASTLYVYGYGIQFDHAAIQAVVADQLSGACPTGNTGARVIAALNLAAVNPQLVGASVVAPVHGVQSGGHRRVIEDDVALEMDVVALPVNARVREVDERPERGGDSAGGLYRPPHVPRAPCRQGPGDGV